MKLTPSYTFTIKKAGAKMGISKKQFTLAAKAGLTREQAARFIGTAGQEPSPTEAYEKVGQLLKGRTPAQAMKQVEPTLNKPEPKASALAGIKPIEPEVSQAQPKEQPKVEAATAAEMIKPVEQPKPFEKRNIKAVPRPLAKKDYYQQFVEYDFSNQDPKLNTLFGNILSGDLFNELGLELKVKNLKEDSSIGEQISYNNYTGEVVERFMKFSVSKYDEEKGTAFNALIHEAGHLIDVYCGSKTKKDAPIIPTGGKDVKRLAYNHLSDDIKLQDAISNYTHMYDSGGDIIIKKLQDFVDFNTKIYETGSEELLKNPQYAELNRKYNEGFSKLKEVKLELENGISKGMTFEEKGQIWEKYTTIKNEYDIENAKTQILELEKQYDKFNTKDTAASMHDIVSAITYARGNKPLGLKGMHTYDYYQNKNKRSTEIFTHYLTMKAHPDKRFYNKFKETFPEINTELERLYDTAYQIMGGK
jgi:hypothetical protein